MGSIYSLPARNYTLLYRYTTDIEIIYSRMVIKAHHKEAAFTSIINKGYPFQ